MLPFLSSALAAFLSLTIYLPPTIIPLVSPSLSASKSCSDSSSIIDSASLICSCFCSCVKDLSLFILSITIDFCSSCAFKRAFCNCSSVLASTKTKSFKLTSSKTLWAFIFSCSFNIKLLLLLCIPSWSPYLANNSSSFFLFLLFKPDSSNVFPP